MKKYLLIIFLAVAYGCSDSSDKKEIPSDKLRTPSFGEILENNSTFNGALVVYPCDATTTAYFGNYKSIPTELQIYPATYLFGKNNYIKGTPPVLLPIGEYLFLYWGVSNSNTPTYKDCNSREPALRYGTIMKDAVISLVETQFNSGIYYPVFDYVFSRQKINVGQQEMSGELLRVGGGVIINIADSQSAPFDNAISEIYAEIGTVAKSVNFYSTAPSDFTATVRISLTISPDRLSATNDMAILFPSGETLPSITVKIKLVSGSTKSYTKTLENGIEAGKVLTIDISSGDILVTPEDGGFEVEGWTETKETISI